MTRSRTLHHSGSFLLLWAVLFGLLFSPALRQAQAAPQAGIEIKKNEVEMNLPKGLTFYLHASAESKIKDAVLIYSVDMQSCQEQMSRQPQKFTAEQQVELAWELKFDQSGPLPPGAHFWWQWQITTESGEKLETEVMRATVTDQRQNWQSLSRNGVRVQWYLGSKAFGSEMMDIAVKAANRLANEMGARVENEVTITIYPSAAEVVEALIYGPEWAGGVAFPEYSTILIGDVSPEDKSYAYSVIPHELAHLVVGKLTFNCQGVSLPTWLSEGLAVYAEGPILRADRQKVEQALARDSLPELVTLRSGFSNISAKATLSYTESGMVVEFLANKYGSRKLAALLEAFTNGSRDDAALTEVYGFDTAGLDRAWRASLGYTLPTLTPTAEGGAVTRPTRTQVPTLALSTSIVFATAVPSDTPPPPDASPTPTPASTRTPVPLAVLVTETAAATLPATATTLSAARPGGGFWLLALAGAGVLALLALILIAFFILRTRS